MQCNASDCKAHANLAQWVAIAYVTCAQSQELDFGNYQDAEGADGYGLSFSGEEADDRDKQGHARRA